jgi:glycosyltransferase involved in cell wall biosynthesis
MTAGPQVSVIIAAYQSHATIAGCLETLRHQTFRDFETIVVNSSPGDPTRELVTTQFPEVQFFENQTRLLPHAARNRGVLLARGQILAFTDADCRSAPDWVERLVKAQAAGHDVVCGSIEPERRSWFDLGVHLCKYSFRLSGLREGPCAIAGTANASYSRRVFDAVGPFDGDQYSGDVLLSWQAARRGCSPWFEPRAVVHHTFQHSGAAFWRERLERGADFARARTTFEKWSRLRLLTYLVSFPLLPIVQLVRGCRDALQCGWGVVFLSTLPLQFVGHLAWSLGEMRVHWRLLRVKP